jgi:hypothetical protein
MRREIAQLELHDLEKVLNNTDAGDDEEQSFDSYASKQDAPEPKQAPPIDSAVMAKMLPRLQSLPREALDQFLQKFRIQRVKELKASDQAAAFELLSKFEAELHPAQEIDPFA